MPREHSLSRDWDAHDAWESWWQPNPLKITSQLIQKQGPRLMNVTVLFFYLSYYARKVLLWVLKENGDNLFRCSVKVDNKTLVDEGAFDLDGFVDISLRGFGILPSQKCDDWSLSETIRISLHNEGEADLRGAETPETDHCSNGQSSHRTWNHHCTRT